MKSFIYLMSCKTNTLYKYELIHKTFLVHLNRFLLGFRMSLPKKEEQKLIEGVFENQTKIAAKCVSLMIELKAKIWKKKL